MILQPKVSKIFLGLLSFVHIGALFCLWIIPFYMMVKAFLTIIIIIHYVYNLLSRVFLLGKSSIVKIFYRTDATWHLYFCNDYSMQAILLKKSIVTRYLIILYFKISGVRCTQSVLLFPDSELREKLRRLRAIVLMRN